MRGYLTKGPIIAYTMFYHRITQLLLADIAEFHGMDLSRDLATLDKRVQSEGLPFLTKGLPSLGKDLDSYLSCGKTPLWTGFACDKEGYPKFLGTLLRLVYPTVKSVHALKHLRQLFYLFYKLEQPFDDHMVAKFSKSFVETDESLPLLIDREDPVLDCARDIISHVLHRFEKDNILPRHGPGSVAEGIRHSQKMHNMQPYDCAEEQFPFYEWCVPSLSAVCDNYHNYSSRESKAFGTAKVLFVPKDSRGPRVISCEPSTLQYLQQGIAREMVRCIEHSTLSRGRVNFADQSINRKYAFYGSLGGGWATLDMKDASDRVSVALVERLFSNSHVLDMLLATRSQATVLPNGTAVPLRKFAPMGSALCFPVEALVFWALAVGVLIHHVGYSRERAIQLVKVYGDDIICCLEDYEALIQYFPTVGLMFNSAKCCTSGLFRESCGLDVFNGVDVTPIKIRTCISLSKNNSAWLPSYCAYQRAFWRAKLHHTAEGIRDYVDGVAKIPRLSTEVDVAFYYMLDWIPNLEHFPRRYNVELHRREVYAMCPIPKVELVPLGGYERLHWFLTSGALDSRDGEPLFPVRFRVTHKKRWCDYSHAS